MENIYGKNYQTSRLLMYILLYFELDVRVSDYIACVSSVSVSPFILSYYQNEYIFT